MTFGIWQLHVAIKVNNRIFCASFFWRLHTPRWRFWQRTDDAWHLTVARSHQSKQQVTLCCLPQFCLFSTLLFPVSYRVAVACSKMAPLTDDRRRLTFDNCTPKVANASCLPQFVCLRLRLRPTAATSDSFIANRKTQQVAMSSHVLLSGCVTVHRPTALPNIKSVSISRLGNFRARIEAHLKWSEMEIPVRPPCFGAFRERLPKYSGAPEIFDKSGWRPVKIGAIWRNRGVAVVTRKRKRSEQMICANKHGTSKINHRIILTEFRLGVPSFKESPFEGATCDVRVHIAV